MKKALIYKYRCNGTMLPEYHSVSVYDNGEVVIEEGSLLDSTEFKKKALNMPIKEVKKIQEILSQNDKLFEIKKIEDGGMIVIFDGVEDELYFANGERSNKIEINNFWDKRQAENIINLPNLFLLAKVYREIKRILIANGVNKDYL